MVELSIFVIIELYHRILKLLVIFNLFRLSTSFLIWFQNSKQWAAHNMIRPIESTFTVLHFTTIY